MRYSLTVRRSFLVFIFCAIHVLAHSEVTFRVCCYYDGFWGSWRDYRTEGRGSYSGFTLYDTGDHPSAYYFAFWIDRYTPPTKKEKKLHNKKKTWWEYTGTVEYYISDVYPTLKDCLKEFGRPLKVYDTKTYQYERLVDLARLSNIKKNGQAIGLKKIQTKAIIKIEPYKKHPKVYNIWADGVGFAISLNGCHF